MEVFIIHIKRYTWKIEQFNDNTSLKKTMIKI